MVQGFLIHRQGRAVHLGEALGRAAQAVGHVGGSEGFEFKHGAPAEQRVVDVEIGVLGGGGDEGDGAVLDALQQALLLLFVQILYLVQIEQQAALALQGCRSPPARP